MSIGNELEKIFKRLGTIEGETKRVKVGTIRKEHLEQIKRHSEEVQEVKDEIQSKIDDFKRQQKREYAAFQERLSDQYIGKQDQITAEKTTLFMLAAEGDEKLQNALFAENSYFNSETGEVFLKLSKKEKVVGQIGEEIIEKLKANTAAYESLEDELRKRLKEVTSGIEEEFHERGTAIDDQQEKLWYEVLQEIDHDGDIDKDEFTVDMETGKVAIMRFE